MSRPPATNIVTDLTEMGVRLPKELLRLDAIHAALEAYTQPHRNRVGGNIAYAEGELNTALGTAQTGDQAVAMLEAAAVHLAATPEAVKLYARVGKALATQIAHGVQDAYPAIYAHFRPGFDAGVAELAEVVKVLGPGDPDLEAILVATGKERERLEAAHKARLPAMSKIRQALQVTTTLAVAGFGSGVHRVYNVLSPEPDYTPEQLAEAEALIDAHRGDVSGLIHAGFSLMLNTPEVACSIPVWAQDLEAERRAAEEAKATKAKKSKAQQDEERLNEAWGVKTEVKA